MRLNHVMRRVGLPQIPPTLLDLIPSLRLRVRQRMPDLLNYPPPPAIEI
jgi:hypothetical protein